MGKSSFNTSHVVIYLLPKMILGGGAVSFNTSHVVIYRDSSRKVDKTTLFQYIPCCYLSMKMVEVNSTIDKFQYIPCCYLSGFCITTNSVVGKFQYIPCCYLSNEFKAFSFLPFLVYPCIIYHFPFFYQPF